MRNHPLAAILTGTAIVSAIVITLPTAAHALSGSQVNDIAREITILIRGERGGHGSGVIIQKSGNTYHVLTAYHVVSKKDNFKLITTDKEVYAIDGKVQRIAGVDLAVVSFTSTKNYAVAKISSAKTNEGQDVFVSGWPSNGSVGKDAGGELVRQFTSGSISGFLPKSIDGYSMIYTNVTRSGMSGCPVLDTAGRLVGIHGKGDTEDTSKLREAGVSEDQVAIAAKLKSGFNYAIPIGVFLQKSNSVGVNSSALQIDKSKAPEAGAAYVASSQPDPRDKIDNIQTTLKSVRDVRQTVDETKRTVDSVRDIFKKRW